ncbi:hypothetical protein XENOCAPTIV_001460, partial [Xenoophorus captivus]
VSRQVSQCNCPKRFQVEQISANRYRVSPFCRHKFITSLLDQSKPLKHVLQKMSSLKVTQL